MKTQKLFFFGLLAGLFIISCTRQLGGSSKDLQKRVERTAKEWSELSASADLSYENIHSWVPESGIRGRYEIARSVIGKSVLETIIGEKAFLSGPHDDGINYDSREFGYYNPAFLNKLKTQLTTLSTYKILVDQVQPFYDRELKQYLRTFYLAYAHGANNAQIKAGYLAAIQNAPTNKDSFLDEPSYFLQESFREFAESTESQGYDVYEAFVCPGFWVRRSIDGTADEFYQLLRLTMNTFDTEFLKK